MARIGPCHLEQVIEIVRILGEAVIDPPSRVRQNLHIASRINPPRMEMGRGNGYYSAEMK